MLVSSRCLVGAMVVVVALQPAIAKPRIRDMDMFETGEPSEPCSTGKTWPIVERCLAKLGSIAPLYKDDHTKLVSLTGQSKLARLVLYAQTDTGWLRTGFTGALTPQSELVSTVPFTTPSGTGVRIDMGMTVRSNVQIGDGSMRKAVWHRTYTTVCMSGTWQCLTLMTTCETYVNGRALYSFHGEPVWHRSLGLRLRGDASTAGNACKPPGPFLIGVDE